MSGERGRYAEGARLMRIALFSDVHANLPALESVLADIAGAQVDATYHLGDLVGYAPWPNEVTAAVVASGIAGVSGNYDSTVALAHNHCGCKYEDPVQEAQSHESFAWTRAHVTEAARRALGALPFRMDVRPLGGHMAGPKLVLVHGTPLSNVVYWTQDRSDDFGRKMAAAAGLVAGDAIAFGHTHVPWTREVDGVRFVNAGSVGRPKDGDARAGWVLMTWSAAHGWLVDHRSVEYDVKRAALGILASDLPPAFADFLRAGGTKRTHEPRA